METIIHLLLAHIQVLNNQIQYLLIFIAKNIRLTSKPSDWNSPKYNKLKVDKLPIVKVREKKNFRELLEIHLISTGKILRPVIRRGGSKVPSQLRCACCNAPSEYLYSNDGGRGQFLCKVCESCFSTENYFNNPITIACPHCGHALDLKKYRKNFNIHKCINDSCSYYKASLKALSSENLAEFNDKPYKFKVRYIYREFTTNFFKVDLFSLPKGASSLSFRKFSPHIMGLCLTYLVNCGLSTRKTQSILREVHRC